MSHDDAYFERLGCCFWEGSSLERHERKLIQLKLVSWKQDPFPYFGYF